MVIILVCNKLRMCFVSLSRGAAAHPAKLFLRARAAAAGMIYPARLSRRPLLQPGLFLAAWRFSYFLLLPFQKKLSYFWRIPE